MPESESVTGWIAGAKRGDSEAVNQIWGRYFEQLVRRVRGRLRGQNRAASDEEDVVLSVFDSFYEAAERGRFPDLTDRDDLWHLLLRMSSHKIIDKRRHDGRIRRGGQERIESIDADVDENERAIEIIGREPSPEMVVSMQETAAIFFSRLGVGQLRDLAGAKLEGYSNAELAKRFECSERTIERRLHLIREKCLQEMLPSDEPSKPTTTDRDPGTN